MKTRKNHEIFSAVAANDYTWVWKLIDKDRSCLLANNEKGQTPIELAAELKFWECVKIMTQTRVASGDVGHFNYALLYASAAGEVEVVRSLLLAGAETKAHFATTKNTPLHLAIRKQSLPTVKALLKYSNLNATNLEGETPMQLATDLDAWAIIDAIAEDATDREDKAKFSYALAKAVSLDKIESAEKLLRAWALMTGHTPSLLHRALANKSIGMVNLLLKYNAPYKEKNKDGETALRSAVKSDYLEGAKAIIDFYVKNKISTTVTAQTFNYAIEHNNEAMVKQLLRLPLSDDHELIWRSVIEHDRVEMIPLVVRAGLWPHPETYAYARELKKDKCLDKFFEVRNDATVATTSALKRKSEELYGKLMENGYAAHEIVFQIAQLQTYDLQILKNELEVLQKKRDELKRAAGADLPLQTTNPSSDYSKMSLLITTLQTLLNYPRQMVVLPAVDSARIPEIQAIVDYMSRKQQILAYENRIRAYLEKLEMRISQGSFKIKNWLGIWVDGVPDQIMLVKDELAKLKAPDANKIILTIHRNITNIFKYMPSSDRRHPATIEFYHDVNTELDGLSFVTGPEFVSQPAPVQVPSAPYASTLAPSCTASYPNPLGSVPHQMQAPAPAYYAPYAPTASFVQPYDAAFYAQVPPQPYYYSFTIPAPQAPVEQPAIFPPAPPYGDQAAASLSTLSLFAFRQPEVMQIPQEEYNQEKQKTGGLGR